MGKINALASEDKDDAQLGTKNYTNGIIQLVNSENELIMEAKLSPVDYDPAHDKHLPTVFKGIGTEKFVYLKEMDVEL